MKTVKCIIVVFLSLLLVNKPTKNLLANTIQENTRTVENILDQYSLACGGAHINDIKTVSGKGTLVRYKSGHVPFTYFFKEPGKINYHQIFAWGDQVCYGFNGNNAWRQTTEKVEIMEDSELIDFQLIFDVQLPIKFKALYPFMILKESEGNEKNEIVTIIAKSENGKSIELDFNTETGFLVRAGNIFFEDYREVGLIKRPYRILLGRDQGEEHRQMVIQFTEIMLNTEINESLFEIPTCALQKTEAPLYKKRKAFSPVPEILDKCVGLYEDTNKNQYRIFREEKYLFFDFVGRSLTMEIIPESETDYYTKFLGWDFHFIKDNSDKITQLIISSNFEIRATRIE